MKKAVRLPFPELLYPYSPVATPMPVPPVTDVCEGDLVCVQFSCSLVPYVLGLLEVYRYKDSFVGTDEEKTIAVGVMRQLMEVFGMACCGDSSQKLVLRRIDPVSGLPQISTDGGSTWVSDPQSIYNQAIQAKPLTTVPGDVLRCEAANNVIENMKDIKSDWATAVGQLTDLTDLVISLLVSAVALLLAPIGVALIVTAVSALIPRIISLARYLIGVTPEQYEALFTENNWTLARCIIYCNTPDNGNYTENDRQAIMAQMRAQITNPNSWAGDSLACMVDVWDVVGLKNASRIGSGGEGNCDDCDCTECQFEVTFDALNWQEFTVDYGTLSENRLHVETHQFPLGEGSGSRVLIDLMQYCTILHISCDFLAINQRPDHAMDINAIFYDDTMQVLGTEGFTSSFTADGVEHHGYSPIQGYFARYIGVEMSWLNNYGVPNSGWIDNIKINFAE